MSYTALYRKFRPAEFEIRILFDENQNGKWDYGSFFGEKRRFIF